MSLCLECFPISLAMFRLTRSSSHRSIGLPFRCQKIDERYFWFAKARTGKYFPRTWLEWQYCKRVRHASAGRAVLRRRSSSTCMTVSLSQQLQAEAGCRPPMECAEVPPPIPFSLELEREAMNRTRLGAPADASRRMCRAHACKWCRCSSDPCTDLPRVCEVLSSAYVCVSSTVACYNLMHMCQPTTAVDWSCFRAKLCREGLAWHRRLETIYIWMYAPQGPKAMGFKLHDPQHARVQLIYLEPHVRLHAPLGVEPVWAARARYLMKFTSEFCVSITI